MPLLEHSHNLLQQFQLCTLSSIGDTVGERIPILTLETFKYFIINNKVRLCRVQNNHERKHYYNLILDIPYRVTKEGMIRVAVMKHKIVMKLFIFQV